MRIAQPNSYLYYEVYRDGLHFATVLTWKKVLDVIFEDHQLTNGRYNYSFAQFIIGKKNETSA